MAIKKVQLPDNSTQDINDARIASTDITQWNGKQDTLVSGTNIKTVNNESLLGSGNISVVGTPGEPGDDGVGISSVVQTTESTVSGGTNVITVTKTDGTSSTFNVKNGDKGDKGDPGPKGDTGDKGDKGDTGDPGITSATVSVDPSTGTPSAQASITNKVLALAFSGLKGETGPQGATGASGAAGADGVGIASVVQTTESSTPGGTNVITITKTDGTTSTVNVKNGDAVGSVVVSQDRGVSTTSTMSQDAITKELQEITGYRKTMEDAYVNVTWEAGRIDTDGSVISGWGAVSKMLPVVPQETLSLNGLNTIYVAYFDKAGSFISRVSMSSGMNDYTVPDNAYYARFQFDSSGDGPRYYCVRRKTFENKSFSDLILSPLSTRPSIGFTGDSNTSGYGVTGNKSWANLMSDALTGITSMRYDVNSPWVYALGYGLYSGGANMRAGSVFGIKTDANSITLGYAGQYSAAWDWYVDGVQTGTASSDTLTLDGNLHTVEARFTAGQLFVPHFIVPKGITCTNNATFGASISNMTFVSGYDWIFIMIGTNQRTGYTFNDFKFGEYAGKGTYIVPFPNHRSESAYNISQLQAYTYEMDIFRNIGYDVLNLSDFNAAPFYDSTYYQEDGIHFNAAGHKVIANMVAGHLGLPLCLQV